MLTKNATSRFTEANGLKLHYHEAGEGAPLIMTSGNGVGSSTWYPYHRSLPFLAPHFRCLLLDQPGYGGGDVVIVKGESRSTMYARTIRDFMDSMGIEKASLVDMSFGAQTAQVFALTYPERVDRIVMHAAALPGPSLIGIKPDAGFKAMGRAFDAPSMETMREMMRTFFSPSSNYSDDELDLQERLDAWLSRPEQDEARRKSDAIWRDLSDEIKNIEAPVLQINGKYDLLAPLEEGLRLFNLIPNGRLVVLNDCGHWIPFEKPEEFAWLVTAFLKNPLAQVANKGAA